MSVFDEVSEPASSSSGGYGSGYPSTPSGQDYSHGDPYASTDSYGSGQKSNMGLWIGLAIGGAFLLLVIGGLGLYWMFSSGPEEAEVADNSSQTEQFSSSSSPANKNITSNPSRSTRRSSQEAKEAAELAKELAERKKKNDELKRARDAKSAEDKRIRDEEYRKRDEARALEQANRTADKAGVQREGESFTDWVTRSCERTDYRSEKFFEVLEGMEVVPEQLDFVSSSLCAYLEENGNKNFVEVSAAMSKWRTPETDEAILACVGNKDFGGMSEREPLMKALSKIGTAEAAEGLALALDSNFGRNQVKPYLIALGSLAEPAVIPYLDYESTSVRKAAYEVIEEIGTRESLKMLTRNLGLERPGSYKTACQSAIDAIEARHPEGEAADDQ